MVKQWILALSASVLVAMCGCVRGAYRGSIPEPPPNYWKPYLQPHRPILRQRDIGRNSVVIGGRNGVVIYDRDEDRWQEYIVPKGRRVAASYPHLWWTSSTARGKYWNLKSGAACSFQAFADELFRLPAQPADMGVHPRALIVADKCWSWIPSAKTYRCFDPFKDRWLDLPRARELPAGRTVHDVVETAESIRMVLGPRHSCAMTGTPLSEYAVCTYGKAEGKWSVTKATAWSDVTAAEYLDAGKGWWRLRDGFASWQPKDVNNTAGRASVWYGMFRSGGRLWGWADDRFVEVTGFDQHTGDPQPPLSKCRTLYGQFVNDGKYIWELSGEGVLRHTPDVAGTRRYRTMRGVGRGDFSPRFTSRGIWFGGRQRYDRKTGKWKPIVWQGAPLPENNRRFGCAVAEDETFILVYEDTLPVSIHKYRGIARYDPETNIATYYSGELIASGNWPFGAVAPLKSGPNKDSVPHLVNNAWNMVRQRRGLCGRPWSTSGELAVIENGKLLIKGKRGEVVQVFEKAKRGLPDIVTKDALWFLLRGKYHALVLDRQTGEISKIAEGFHGKRPIARVSFYGHEAVVVWCDLTRRDKRGMSPWVGCAVVELKDRTVTVMSRRDFYRADGRCSGMSMDSEWAFVKFNRKTGSFIMAKHRPTGRWVRIPYLTEYV
jgi:hypothetical protein